MARNRKKPSCTNRETGKNQQKALRKIVKNTGKIRSEAESYSASEAAAVLGVSIPTLKRMVAEDRLESFCTPGGHLRVSADSVKTIRDRGAKRTLPVIRSASPVLQNRRERLEELTLEAQELRARRELSKLQQEDQHEADQQREEKEAREQEDAERQAEVDTEQERLEQRLAEERSKQEAERAIAAFRCRWLEKATQALTMPPCGRLSAAQKKEILDAAEAEINKRQPIDAPRMATILGHAIAALVERYNTERQAAENRQEVIDNALRSLSAFATDQEKARAAIAVREAVRRLGAIASETELLMSTREALRPVNQAIEKRRKEARILNWAIGQLPWNKTELDAARVRRECAEILAEVPGDIADAEAKAALEPTVREACQDIEERQASKQLQASKAQKIEHGVAEVSNRLWELKCAEELTADEYFDSDFAEHLKTVVRRRLRAELSGDERHKEVRDLVRKIIDGELS
jgi:excisionase family DNA binding protein